MDSISYRYYRFHKFGLIDGKEKLSIINFSRVLCDDGAA
jgi:hypothetical protein